MTILNLLLNRTEPLVADAETDQGHLNCITAVVLGGLLAVDQFAKKLGHKPTHKRTMRFTQG